MRDAVRALDPDMPLFSAMTIDEALSGPRFSWRLYGTMFGIFAGIALVLATVGLSGTIAYAVTQRTREIGIRVALGARAPHVLWMVLRQGIVRVTAGLVLGFGAAVAVGRFLSSILVGAEPAPAIMLGSIAAVFVTVTLTALLIPARRATRLNPVVALRCE